MHIERNVSDNVLKHLFSKKDTLECRRDMMQAGRMHHLHLVRGELENYIKPRAPYVFSETEKQQFIQLVSSTKVPTGYSSTLAKHVGEKRLNGLKSHNHHVLIQQILPSAIRHSLSRGVCETIIWLVNVLQRICAKVIRTSEVQSLRTAAAEVFACLKLTFPLAFLTL